jgi:hypothetical protein
MTAGLDQAKLEKEIEKLSAEVDKLRAETKTLTTGQSGLRRQIERGASLIIAAAGFATALGTCHGARLDEQIAQLAKTKAELETAQAEKVRQDAHAQIEAALKEKASVLEGLAAAKNELAQANATYALVRGQTDALKANSCQGQQQLVDAVATLGTRLENAGDSLASAAPSSTKGTVLLFPALPEQSEVAQALRNTFLGDGFRSTLRPLLKNPERAPEQTEVRYFRATDASAARSIVGVLRDKGVAAVPSQVDDPDITFPHYFEIRFAAQQRVH